MGKDKNSNYNEDTHYIKNRMLPQCGGSINIRIYILVYMLSQVTE